MDWAKDAKIPIHVNSDNRFELQDLWNGKVVGQVVIGESVWNSHLATHENQAFKLTPIFLVFLMCYHFLQLTCMLLIFDKCNGWGILPLISFYHN